MNPGLQGAGLVKTPLEGRGDAAAHAVTWSYIQAGAQVPQSIDVERRVGLDIVESPTIRSES